MAAEGKKPTHALIVERKFVAPFSVFINLSSLSGTQKLTLAPLRGEKAAKGRKPTHALTIER
ncbi:hypothetical protein LR48_Vigan04g103900 [Vigna angularis]|uniref:Uncharacterized protein n=1 Tax=Phaseolus angularis TaxID=3914 RepID=A0A0L9UDP9_PHAAN|nr:hypothetical protein LR48_Vigan04g103900 [Vigna angularis]